MKILFLFVVAALILFPKETQNQTINNYQVEWDNFCKVWMGYVNKYPKALSAGCCDIDHPSNDILKEGWEGESLLNCYG
tara:strand:- start:202 stop:438 length:237 start_codon:yes stop_codon:yes gene_type:complete